jgi:DNA-binding NarL/FixJ family response regulator
MTAPDVRVPVKVWIRADAYRAYAKVAHERRCDVGTLIEQQVEKSVRRVKPKRSYKRFDDECLAQARELARAGRTKTEIAEETGVSAATIHNHWQRIIGGLS